MSGENLKMKVPIWDKFKKSDQLFLYINFEKRNFQTFARNLKKNIMVLHVKQMYILVFFIPMYLLDIIKNKMGLIVFDPQKYLR